MDKQKIEEAMRMLMEDGIGLDMNDEHFKGTPERIGRMYEEMFSGLKDDGPKVTTFSNKENYDEMIGLANISFVSMCPHHFLPWVGKAAIAYIPKPGDEGGKIVGISKPARIIDFFARRPIVQEKMTPEIAKYIDNTINPHGCGVRLVATHQCMACRGANKPGALAVTTALTGVFKNADTKGEFLDFTMI